MVKNCKSVGSLNRGSGPWVCPPIVHKMGLFTVYVVRGFSVLPTTTTGGT